jgi:hypothetical protein
MKRKTLKTVIREILETYPPGTRWNVYALELWGNRREGLEVNDAWTIARDADAAEVVETASGRWEIFKINYHPKARVRDLDCGEISPDFECNLECGMIPFLTLRPLTPTP